MLIVALGGVLTADEVLLFDLFLSLCLGPRVLGVYPPWVVHGVEGRVVCPPWGGCAPLG